MTITGPIVTAEGTSMIDVARKVALCVTEQARLRDGKGYRKFEKRDRGTYAVLRDALQEHILQQLQLDGDIRIEYIFTPQSIHPSIARLVRDNTRSGLVFWPISFAVWVYSREDGTYQAILRNPGGSETILYPAPRRRK